MTRMPEKLWNRLSQLIQDSRLRVTGFEWDVLREYGLNVSYIDSGGNYFNRDFYLNEDGQVVFREND